MSEKKPDLEKVYIRWKDSASISGGGWHLQHDMDQLEPLIIDSIGWLYREEKDFLVLVPHLEDDQTNFGGEMCIPKGAVLQRRKITFAGK